MVEEVTTKSWGSRLKDAVIGVLIGLLCIGGSIWLAFWNESHGLHTAQSLTQAQKQVINVAISPVNPQNNLKVVYLSGKAVTQEQLTDPLLELTLNAIALDRQVLMYQWQEDVETRNESQLGGSERTVKTYSYKKVWSEALIDSSTFKDQAGHQNPSSMPFQSQHFIAQHVQVGDFVLPAELIKRIDNSSIVDLSKADLTALKAESGKTVKLGTNEIYVGNNNASPQPGDLRVSLSAVLPQTVSIVAQQNDQTLQPYQAPAGKTVMLLNTGAHSSDELFTDAFTDNTMVTWVLRLISFALLFAGFSLILKPLVVLADVLPFAGTIVSFGTGFVAFVCALVVWLIVTAIAWFVIRPFVSIGLILAAVLLFFGLMHWRKKPQLLVKSEQDTQGLK